MAKIAVARDATNGPQSRRLASGEGWTVWDVVCSSGPCDRPFEERHNTAAVAIVVSGTFQYRALSSRELMTPGSLMLGTPGQSYECSHEHGIGDRCISMSYAPELFERIAHDAGSRGTHAAFRSLRLPPLRELSRLVARASDCTGTEAWNELAVELAAGALQVDHRLPTGDRQFELAAEARVTRVVRMIEEDPGGTHTVDSLAREARLSAFHFLRTFEALTGVTPHQYLLRLRVRRAATRIAVESGKILDIALDCGFGDISNFNRTFRAEFGLTPRAYRARYGRTSDTRR